MRTVEIEVFSFDELKPEIQKKVLENYRYINIEHSDFWSESTINFWKEKLSEFGFEDSKIYLSGFSSQGDGASFDANVNLEKILKNAPEQFKKLIIAKDNINLTIEETSYSSHYSHERTRYIDGFFENCSEKFVNCKILLSDFVNWLENERLSKSKEIYKDLEKEYNYQCSDEAIKEEFAANEIEFYKNGKLFSE